MKTLEEVLHNILRSNPSLSNNNDWFHYLSINNKSKNVTEFAGVIKDILKLAAVKIDLGDDTAALNLLGFAIAADPAKAEDYLRSEGTLRLSKYNFESPKLAKIINSLIRKVRIVDQQLKIENYLLSVGNLIKYGSAISESKRSLVKQIGKYSDTILKSVVAYADTIYMCDHKGSYLHPTDEINGYIKEDLAEATSYIIHLFIKENGIRDENFNYLDEDRICSGYISSLIIKAAKIKAYCEAEIMLDSFDYTCKRIGNTVSIIPPYPEFEKSIRLGYVLSGQARISASVARDRSIREGAVSTARAAKDFHSVLSSKIIKLKHTPVSRYVFNFPNVDNFKKFFTDDSFTFEEKDYLKEVLSSEMVNWDDLKRFSFEGGATFIGLLKVHRLLSFISHFSASHFSSKMNSEPRLVYRSIVPVFSKQQLINIFRICVDEAEANAILSLISIDSNDGGIVDIQSKPIISGREYYMLPLNISGSNNWYRNLAYSEKRRVLSDAEEDGASNEIEKCLSKYTQFVKTEYETKINDERFEIDVICRFGDYLIIFESKNSLLPCNVFELRTSYKHITKGASQLSRIQRILSDHNNEKELYRRLGWNVGPSKEVLTCIVSCNGMFPGLRIDGHPVRRLWELMQMLEKGSINFVTAKPKINGDIDDYEEDTKVYSIWDDEILTADFIYKYLKKDHLQKMLFNSMVEVRRTFKEDVWRLEYFSYANDPHKFKDELDGYAVSKNDRRQ